MNFVDALKAAGKIAERERRWVEVRRASIRFHTESTLVFPTHYHRPGEPAGISIGSQWAQTQSYDDFIAEDWEVAPPHWEQSS